MKTEMCLVICFLVGVLVFYLLKQSCGCSAVVEGQGVCSTVIGGVHVNFGAAGDPCTGLDEEGCTSAARCGWEAEEDSTTLTASPPPPPPSSGSSEPSPPTGCCIIR